MFNSTPLKGSARITSGECSEILKPGQGRRGLSYCWCQDGSVSSLGNDGKEE